MYCFHFVLNGHCFNRFDVVLFCERSVLATRCSFVLPFSGTISHPREMLVFPACQVGFAAQVSGRTQFNVCPVSLSLSVLPFTLQCVWHILIYWAGVRRWPNLHSATLPNCSAEPRQWLTHNLRLHLCVLTSQSRCIDLHLAANTLPIICQLTCPV